MLLNEIKALYEQRPIPSAQIAQLMAASSIHPQPQDLATLQYMASLDDFMEQRLAYPAMALMPAWGEPGLDHLVTMALEHTHPWAAYNILATTGLNRVVQYDDLAFLPNDWDRLPKYTLSSQTASLAIHRLRRLVLDEVADPHGRDTFLSAVTHLSLVGCRNDDDREHLLLSMLVDSRMMLNQTLLTRYQELLETPQIQEEQLHQFLAQHPILIDPYANEIRSKHELGSDFITDFIVRRTNDEYVLVEIEKSTDSLFRQDGTFSTAVNKATAQVRDFQAWVNHNIAYAQTKLPGLRRPEGLVVIGRRTELDKNMEARLSEENFSRRGHIKIVTFDDLLSQARIVYRNMLERPLVLRTRDQRTI